jgi:hypothetical protein
MIPYHLKVLKAEFDTTRHGPLALVLQQVVTQAVRGTQPAYHMQHPDLSKKGITLYCSISSTHTCAELTLYVLTIRLQ